MQKEAYMDLCIYIYIYAHIHIYKYMAYIHMHKYVERQRNPYMRYISDTQLENNMKPGTAKSTSTAQQSYTLKTFEPNSADIQFSSTYDTELPSLLSETPVGDVATPNTAHATVDT